MSDRFVEALDFVLSFEGGFVNDPDDPGGATNLGLSQRAHPDLDIAAQTPDTVAPFYRDDYWRPVAAPDWSDGIALGTFDAAVQHGPSAAIRLLQAAARVKTDGLIGPITRTAVTALRPRQLIVELSARRMGYYAGLDGFERFGLGWSRRLMACQALALAWAGNSNTEAR